MLYAFLCQLSFSSSLPHLCRKDQAHALLQFKKTFTTNADASGCCQSYAKTLSWNRSIDCCSWDGVYCDETTGHVIEFDLSCIQHLKRLDLSFNDFSRSHISPKFGGLSNLTHLDPWGSSFTGQIPTEISYLSMLNVLRIWSEDPYMLTFGPHHYELLLKNLTQLRELEIYDVNISSTIPQNFSSYLTTIQLLNGQLCGTLPERIFHLPNLKLLELSSSGNLSGPILKPLWNLTNTENLSLENNNLEGTIYPFFKFGKLRGLRLRGNNFTGSIPSNHHYTSYLYLSHWISHLTKLGGIPQQLAFLTSVEVPNLPHNHLIGWIPKGKQFDTFEKSSYQGNDGLHGFPLSKDCGDDDGVPQTITPVELDEEEEEEDSPMISWQAVLMSYGCGLVSHMFTINPNASGYCYEDTSFSWNKSTDCCSWNGVRCDETIGQLIELDLYCNGLQGTFHSNSRLFQLSSLKRLDLSYNNFYGSLISPKFGELSSLTHLDLLGSSFTGLIPAEISHLSKLYVLHLQTHDPYGLRLGAYNFELLLKHLTQLRELDLYSMNISSTIPLNFSSYLTTLWLSRTQLYRVFPERFFHLSNLDYLYLSSNSLTGPIPSNVSGLQNLQRLFLSSNYLNRTIPSWIFSLPSLQCDNKGTGLELPRVLTTYMIIDLSRNRFEGYLLSIIGDLVGLCALNLSHNGLEDVIPASLKHLSVLELLDLSSNKIRGEIPQQLVSLTSLAFLNLSHNHLVGCIPKGKQFDTFENSSYQGNDGLHRLPISKDCVGDDGVPQATTTVELDEEEGDLISWQAVLMGYDCGLVIGLSIIYIMLSNHYPVWFSRMVVKFEHINVTRMKRHKKRY
ncbi:hypothetical protein BC332_08658 [Capsicum chinense]|nr:hypothetical protein BC332_08658 [Capsicum chinense]